jgi:hypothetical protein
LGLANIGVTQEFVTEFAASVLAYQTAAAAAEVARQASENATRTATAAFGVMRRNMTSGITTIRAYAERQDDPSAVYTRAEVPPRSSGAPLPAPGRPFDMSVGLIDTTGALQLRWKCDNPPGASGTTYIVRRRLPTETAFTFVGATGEKRFVDSTFLAGPDSVEYTVQGQRADSAGVVSPIFTLNFGQVTRRGTGQQQVTTQQETEKAA